MIEHSIKFKDTGYFSKIICDYLDQSNKIAPFYNNFPKIENFKRQIQEKKNQFPLENRVTLSKILEEQYKNLRTCDFVISNIQKLKDENTFTVTTGHQLNLFTGPLYFLYKIISTIKLAQELKLHYSGYNFVPIFWMASEDHDYQEINNFTLKDKKISWEQKTCGAVGRLSTAGIEPLVKLLTQTLNLSKNSSQLINLFKKAYLENKNLSNASRFLVNELFSDKGLVVVDADQPSLKKIFTPVLKQELKNQISFSQVSKTISKLEKHYKIQVNPRELNLFYLRDNSRERIVFEKGKYNVLKSNISFTKEEILEELEFHPERFSPNVILRPVYQETILPNICYIGGAAELSYWFELKGLFDELKLSFPILLLRNSVQVISKKQFAKMNKLGISIKEIFLKECKLTDLKVREQSKVNIDFKKEKKTLESMFLKMQDIASQTDLSFKGAVKAQEAKQLKGLKKLETRLLKAQKKALKSQVTQIKLLKDDIFPYGKLEERTRNFSFYYESYGKHFIEELFIYLKPLDHNFKVLQI